MRKPAVSIGLATKNGAKTLPFALESLRRQTFRNLEIIISDNASHDATPIISGKFRKKDSRIRYIRQKTPLSYGENFNAVLALARAPYFIWASDDDLWHPDFVRELMARAKPTVAVVTCDYDLFDSRRRVGHRLPFTAYESSRQATRKFWADPGSISVLLFSLFQTRKLKASGGIERVPISFLEPAADTLTLTRILLKGPLIHVPKILFHKRDSGMYLQQFEVIRTLHISKSVRFRIFRFLLSPLVFLFIFLRGNTMVISSDLNVSDKLVLLYASFTRYLMEHIRFFITSIKGLAVLARLP